MKKLSDDGREYFDGQPVEIFEGRFSGSFDMVEEVAAPISMDDQVTFLVSARCSAPKFTYLKDGTIKRTNTLKVELANVLSRHEAMYLLDNMPQEPEAPPAVTDDGEVVVDALFEDD